MNTTSEDIENIAKKSAICYYGFSSSLTSLPKGISMKVYTHCEVDDRDIAYVKNNIADKIDWTKTIGSLSHTARISERDLEYILGRDIPIEKLELWMKALVNIGKNVVLVEILIRDGKRKLLLVNTNITQT